MTTTEEIAATPSDVSVRRPRLGVALAAFLVFSVTLAVPISLLGGRGSCGLA